MTSTNKRKLSKGQRESRTRKEAEAEGGGGRQSLVTGAKLKLWDCVQSGGERERQGTAQTRDSFLLLWDQGLLKEATGLGRFGQRDVV